MDIGEAVGPVIEGALQLAFEGPRWARWGCGIIFLAMAVALVAGLVWTQMS